MGGLTTRSAWTGRQMQLEGWSSSLRPGRAPDNISQLLLRSEASQL